MLGGAGVAGGVPARGVVAAADMAADLAQPEVDPVLLARGQAVEDQIRTAADGRNVFFFVSGGVDSTVAYTLCLKALGADRVHGTYVDTGLMREGET